MNRLIKWFNLIIIKQKGLKRWQRVVTVLAAMITFATTYALILPAITVEKDSTGEVGGMYLEKTANQDDLLEDNALEPVGVSIAADMDNAATFAYADDDMSATAVFSTDEVIPEGAELVVNNVAPESDIYTDLSGRTADLLDREFIYDVTTRSFYDYALVCDNVDVTPKTGLVDIQIIFRNNSVEHVNDVVYAGRFVKPSEKEDGFVELAAGDGNAADELVSINVDESPVIEMTDGIITSLSLKGSDLAQSDSIVGILAGNVDEEVKAAAAETDAEIPNFDETQDEDTSGSLGDTSNGQDENTSDDSEEDGTHADDDDNEITTALPVKALKSSGTDYVVTLTYDESSKIPEGASLTVSEITKDSKEYQTYLDETKKAMGLTEEETLPSFAARFFDIKIVVDGQEFTPDSGVSVEITYAEPLAEYSETEVNAVHFADEKAEAEVIEANTTEVKDNGKATVEFTAESFSVYGVIYTVDFHWEVNGKMYDFSIPGGGFISLEQLVELLGITKTDVRSEKDVESSDNDSENTREMDLNSLQVSQETKEFVARVQSVEFSNPDLVWIGKTKEETTVGKLVAANALEIQYSSEFTEEKISEINAQVVDVGDWVLISIMPFDTEERLTVSMANGDRFVIRVTDAADPNDPLELDEKEYAIVNQRTNGYTDPVAVSDERGALIASNRGYSLVGETVTIEASDGNYYYTSGSPTKWTFEFDSKINDNSAWYYVSSGGKYLTISGRTKEGNTEALTLPTTKSSASLIKVTKLSDGSYSFENNQGLRLWNYSNDTATRFFVDTTDDGNHAFQMYLCTTKPYEPLDGEILSVDDIDVNHRYVIYYYDENTGTYYVLKTDGSTVPFDGNYDLNSLGEEYRWDISYAMGEEAGIYYVSSGANYLSLNEFTEGGNNLVSTTPGFTFFFDFGYGVPGLRVNQADEDEESIYRMTYDPSQDVNKLVAVEAFSDYPDAPIHFLWQKNMRHNFTVKTEYNNVYRGTVGHTDGTNIVTNLAAYAGKTTTAVDGLKNPYTITAEAAPGYEFDYWRLGDTKLEGDAYATSTINAGDLTFPQNGMVLTAVFKKDSTNNGVPDYSQLINQWRENLLKNPIDMEKTAEVYDYDNRIYQVDITAATNSKVFADDIEIAFVTDVSRSMYFPAKTEDLGDSYSFDSVESLNNSLNRLQSGNNTSIANDEVYYVLGDATGTNTLYALRKHNGSWYYIDASYDNMVHDNKKGIADNSSNKWDVYDESNSNSKIGWNPLNRTSTYFSRYGYDTFDNGGWKVMLETNKLLNGRIYKATDYVYRLDYLQQAVDIASDIVYHVQPDAAIGLVTFAASGTEQSYGFYGKDEYDELVNALNDISPKGGTSQGDGLDKATTLGWDDVNVKRRAVILITDGAPNQENREWPYIEAKAEAITDSENGLGATLYTVGLSLDGIMADDNVSVHEKLEGIASSNPNGGKYAYDADDGNGLVRAVLDIIDTFYVEADLKGMITDTVDPAFYPVDEDGNPIESGSYYNEDGEILNAGGSADEEDSLAYYRANKLPYHFWFENSDDTWNVIWYNDLIGVEDDDKNIHEGVHKSILIKAKEDFLGGNRISTNASDAVITVTDYVTRGDNIEGTLVSPIVQQETTPYVNVDELSLTHDNSQETVYLGESVDPLTAVKTLYGNIKVVQIVDDVESGYGDSNMGIAPYKVRTDDGNLIYILDKNNQTNYLDNDVTLNTTAGDPSSYPLSTLITKLQGHDLTNTQWNTLITTGTLDLIPYYGNAAYGHGTEDDPVGNIRITLTQNTVGTEKDLTESPHVTTEVGSPVETYVLTVTYEPVAKEADGYKTGNFLERDEPKAGDNTDEFQSINTHVVNVLESSIDIDIVKLRKDSEERLPGAIFTLRKLTEPDGNPPAPTQNGTFDGIEVGVSEPTAEETGKTSFAELARGYYEITETKVPTGYVLTNSSPIYFRIEHGAATWIEWSSSESKWIEKSSDPMVGFDVPHDAVADDPTTTEVNEAVEATNTMFTVENEPGAALPATGGSGTNLIYILGVILTSLAGAGLVLRQKRKTA